HGRLLQLWQGSHLVFPRWRAAGGVGGGGAPLYLCVTSHRIEAATTALVYRRLFAEAAAHGGPVTVVAAMAEMADQRLVKGLFAKAAPPARVRLVLVRMAATGKRDALAGALVAVARSKPPPGAVVALMDGDTVLTEGTLARTLPFFRSMPDLAGLTTDEEAVVRGGRTMRSWHRLRFAQRHLLMCSMGLGRTLLTMTGRLAFYRAEVATDPDFVRIVRDDALDHWRLGRVPMLTGEDKSTWFWLLERRLPMLYVPDARVVTIEHPPHPGFFRASTALMRRWFGNMIRASGRAIALGPVRVGFFPWWCLVDQRLSMWTPLIGPVAALLAALMGEPVFLQVYVTWVLLTRLVQAALLRLFRDEVDGLWPALIYYNQVWGALIKTHALFHPANQRWTRQRIRLVGPASARLHRAVGASIHALALAALVVAVAFATGTLVLPPFLLALPPG
ncbi:MAG: glycosyltransferase, partial [Geminicoccaceae bacterium]|nr:glycosyltransferase [Geminicoccaceae bacterium]